MLPHPFLPSLLLLLQHSSWLGPLLLQRRAPRCRVVCCISRGFMDSLVLQHLPRVLVELPLQAVPSRLQLVDLLCRVLRSCSEIAFESQGKPSVLPWWGSPCAVVGHIRVRTVIVPYQLRSAIRVRNGHVVVLEVAECSLSCVAGCSSYIMIGVEISSFLTIPQLQTLHHCAEWEQRFSPGGVCLSSLGVI